MPKGQRKSYTKEFKLSVVYAMLGGTQRPKEIFAEYKIDRQTAYRWVSEFKAKGESAFEDKSFTEVKTADGKVYCCGIIYNGKRILAGLEISKRCNGKFAVTTAEHAIARYGEPDIIHTDRGTQFLSKAFRDMMEREGITHSMSRPHKPCDNAPIETFWKSMKLEIGYTEDMTDEEMQMVTEYYGHYYNTLRPHSALGYLSPLAYINLKNVI